MYRKNISNTLLRKFFSLLCSHSLFFAFLLTHNNYFLIPVLYASETMDTAEQIEKGKFRLTFYYSCFENNPAFKVSGPVRISTGPGTGVIVTGAETEILCAGEGNQANVKLTFNPFEGFIWWGKITTILNYTLTIPSTTATSTQLQAVEPGISAGLGIRYQVFPETIVSPGICIDFALTATEINFKKFLSISRQIQIVKNKFEMQELQMSFLVSKKYRYIQPYGGFKVFRLYSKLLDEISLEESHGLKDNVNLYLGAKINLKKFEWLILEGNFIGERSISVGFGGKF